MDTGTGGGFDATLLEGLPLNQFNWGEWNVSPRRRPPQTFYRYLLFLYLPRNTSGKEKEKKKNQILKGRR